MSWTPRDLASLEGRRVVVTGANSGIGWHTAAELGRRGAEVTLACRNVRAAETEAGRMRRSGASTVRVERLDLSSLGSVEDFAGAWTGPLDVLVNNAGVMAPPRYRETADGFELQFGTNHLGHFALTGRLLPRLLEAGHPRVTTVSSLAHGSGGGDVLRANQGGRYSPSRAYGNSKLANLLFAGELQRRAEAAGTRLTSTAAHPGVSATGLVTSRQGLGSLPGVRLVTPAVQRLVLQSAERGAHPILRAVSDAAAPGSYSGPQRLGESRGPAGTARRSALAQDGELARLLWERSEELTGVGYDWD